MAGQSAARAPSSVGADSAASAGASGAHIAAVAAELRARLTPLVWALAGTPPRPVRLMRGIGLDKSLAGRLVQATRAGSDMEFLHTVPSPTGLRILLDKGRAHAAADADLVRGAALAVDRFEALLDALPGGRQALDARMGDSSTSIREKREHMARQASFKAVSFLFGHYCETLTTTLFIVPSAAGETVDLVEIHRRIGLHRLSTTASVPLLSLQARAEGDIPQGPFIASVDGDATTRRPEDFLIAAASSSPLPELRVIDEGPMLTFVLDPAAQTLALLTSAFRVGRVDTVKQAASFVALRNYLLHTPCRTLVRDIYLAEGLWPDAQLQIDFSLPGPSGSPAVALEPGKANHRRVNLTCRIEQPPLGAHAFEMPGIADQSAVTRALLVRAGLAASGYRGWRCVMSHPVPLIEMQVAFSFAGAQG